MDSLIFGTTFSVPSLNRSLDSGKILFVSSAWFDSDRRQDAPSITPQWKRLDSLSTDYLR
jgi:hypothetical protein